LFYKFKILKKMKDLLKVFIISCIAFLPYNRLLAQWTQKADFNANTINAVGFGIGTKGYLGTGINSVYSKECWEYASTTNTWTQKTDFGGAERSSAVSFSIGTKGYLGTGESDVLATLKDFWEYDPSTNAWTQKADFGGTARYIATGFGIGTKGYLGTGYDGSRRKDFWEYDPSTNTWTQKTDLGGAARNRAFSFVIGTKGYIATGYSGTAYLNDVWEYSPSVMPVELIHFKGQNIAVQNPTIPNAFEEGGNALTWQTASELNTAHFDIERSNDGKTFEKIGEIRAKGSNSTYDFIDNFNDTKTSGSSYRMTNASPTLTHYYRLKINDLDGKTEYSKIINLQNIKILRGVKVYPNPVSTTLNIQTESNNDFQILNLLGQQVLRGQTGQAVDVSVLPQGNYILKVGTEQVKFVKQSSSFY
jgi:Secretion system C-terminal sorting domain